MISTGLPLGKAPVNKSNVAIFARRIKTTSAWQCLAVLLCLVAFFPGSEAIAARAGVRGLEAKQTVYVLGMGTVLVSSLGLKWSSNKSTTMLLCCPPAWKIHIFNHSNKFYTDLELNKFTGFYFKEVTACGGLSVNRLSLKRDRETVFKKLPSHHYKSSESYKKAVEERFARSTEFGWEPAYGELTALTPNSSILIPAQAIEALSRLYGMPPRTAETKEEFPLQLKVMTAWRRSADYLLTATIKERLVTKSDYQAPLNYQRKNTLNEVISEKSTAFQELFQEK